MKMLVYLLDLKDESCIASYLERHANIEPEVPKTIRELGVLQNRICRLGTHLVNIMIVEDGFTGDVLKKYVENPACKKWDDEMMQYQKALPEAKPGELWAETEIAFLFDTIGLK